MEFRKVVKYRCLETVALLESGVEHGGEYGEVLVYGFLHIAVFLHIKDKLVYQPLVYVFSLERMQFDEVFKYIGETRISVQGLFRVVVTLAFDCSVPHALQPFADKLKQSRSAHLL